MSRSKYNKESDLTTDILKTLRDMYKDDIFIYKTHGNMFTMEGIPDLECCFKGRYIGMECKLPNKKHTLSDAQKARIKQIRNAGGLAYMVSSLEEAIKIVKKVEQEYEQSRIGTII